MDFPLIAIIDHERVFLDLMNEIDTGDGYRALCWHADEQTFARLQVVQPDLAIVDIPSRQRDAAWALIERIHHDPTTAHIPVIVCTADVPFVREKAPILLQYNYAVIEKPFALDEMLRKVREMLVVGMTPDDPSDGTNLG